MTDLRIESIDGSKCAFDLDFDTATFKWKTWYYDCFLFVIFQIEIGQCDRSQWSDIDKVES